MNISPSLLSANFLNFENDIELVVREPLVKSLHIDVMDGNFVPNITMGHQIVKAIKTKYQNLEIDAHLMVANPERHVDRFIDAKVDSLSFHIEASKHPERLLRYISSKGVKTGVAINPATSLDSIQYIKHALDFVLLMTVNPGFSGQSFILSMFNKISLLRKMVDCKIIVDGGVNADNINKLRELGVDTVVMGNAVFGQKDPKQAIKDLSARILNA